MDNITEMVPSSHRDSSKTTFKPLHDLKFSFNQQSHATSVKGQVSNELPVIKTESTKKRDIRTQTLKYTNVIDETLKLKLKTAQIYDEIASIDFKILESSKKFQISSEKHEKFTKSFENFLNKQYEQVSDSLAELEKAEKESAELRQELQNLRQEGTEKSLEIYELEDIWRKYMTSRNFLLHLSHLLGNDKSYRGEFENLTKSKTSHIDELLIRFRNMGEIGEEFDENNFQHVTADKIEQFLSELKQQNLKLLRYKLQYEKLTNLFQNTDDFLENDFKNNFDEIEKTSRDSREKSQQVEVELAMREKQIETLKTKIFSLQENPELYNFIERLYEKCTNVPAPEKSHLEMIKHIENYCHLLLSTLNSFDQATVRKAMQLSKTK